VPLDGKLPAGKTLLVRFTASNPVATDQIEAGIDDFQVLSLTPACNPDASMPPATSPTPMHGGGCGCDLGGGAPSTGATLLLFALLLLGLQLRTQRKASLKRSTPTLASARIAASAASVNADSST
jgi:MYXO-CTERM domain-containing protein